MYFFFVSTKSSVKKTKHRPKSRTIHTTRDLGMTTQNRAQMPRVGEGTLGKIFTLKRKEGKWDWKNFIIYTLHRPLELLSQGINYGLVMQHVLEGCETYTKFQSKNQKNGLESRGNFFVFGLGYNSCKLYVRKEKLVRTEMFALTRVLQAM
jgi:hypothetical protein